MADIQPIPTPPEPSDANPMVTVINEFGAIDHMRLALFEEHYRPFGWWITHDLDALHAEALEIRRTEAVALLDDDGLAALITLITMSGLWTDPVTAASSRRILMDELHGRALAEHLRRGHGLATAYGDLVIHGIDYTRPEWTACGLVYSRRLYPDDDRLSWFDHCDSCFAGSVPASAAGVR